MPDFRFLDRVSALDFSKSDAKIAKFSSTFLIFVTISPKNRNFSSLKIPKKYFVLIRLQNDMDKKSKEHGKELEQFMKNLNKNLRTWFSQLKFY